MGTASPRSSHDSLSSVSTTSLVFERLSEREKLNGELAGLEDEDPLRHDSDDEEDSFLPLPPKRVIGVDKGFKRFMLVLVGIFLSAWVVGLFTYLSTKSYQHSSQKEHDPTATATRGSGKKVTLDQVMEGYWRPQSHSISWIAGANGEDGLLLEKGAAGKDYLVVEDVRSQNEEHTANGGKITSAQTLMKERIVDASGRKLYPDRVWPSPDLKKVLIATDTRDVWRHSFTGVYWIFDVDTQKAEPLNPKDPGLRVQLAQWSPKSNAVTYTSANNLYVRKLGGDNVTQITKDGGPEYFYGIPDWVYEEEVFGENSATWWSENGDFVAFLRTNETLVPEYPVQFFIDRPSGKTPPAGKESYPEVQQLKYPKAGAPNPFVDLLFYDMARGDMFSVEIKGGFAADDLLITDITWAGNKVLVKETNRVSDIMRVILIDVTARTGKTVRTVDVGKIDGGWFEISHDTTYIPADPANGRPEDGYIDTVIHDNGDHMAYFSPLDTDTPVMLTSGKWEVVAAPSAVDLKNNVAYFVATKESSIQRHIYSVKFDGSHLKELTDISKEAYYEVSFSAKAGYALLTNRGPNVPTQKVISTPSNPEVYEHVIEENKDLADKAKKHELPLLDYGTITVDDVELNYVERRPPHFDPKKQYPVLFHQYSGPGSQTVDKQFSVNFQTYVASNLGYIVVTVDGRGTGFIGRKARVVVRKNLGHYEAHDQIAAAKIWAAKPYVDEARVAIWGWSYGGFQTLKTLEQDGGQTFKYGMAVAPVTDWRFYDSIYTERYMLTPQLNADGYDGTAVSNVTALGQNVRFLVMHGVADDNVHMQNTLTLLDKLDVAGVENYDLHMFPDSNHGIYFHNANRIVYDKLTNWLVNAFNGEWLKVASAKPAPNKAKRDMEMVRRAGPETDVSVLEREVRGSS
ncbi:dipeptidyl peptidase IV N-terminal region-domain-containing protein [Annulohypoxylon maeteangense]|uniref:dipeptidyl peptidase IV N-terminal region-domain-containing protein n=1 Tax=Annulohypoxylon maeteangense TaxID=1927788 RepID=UPI002007E945|nr:dipeptidyl peptidase IV N-terminal region-domain-containing protein [Annulohypoxylon maeteangense]KAI0889609.1 dipeptidyl peptidase IV N-terminal region-domain-containing protein [Annulohypoxylon maeteangense]